MRSRISVRDGGGFNLTMAIGRFTGGAVIQRYGRVPVLRSAGILACVSVTALCLVNSTLVALLGAFGWGLGLSVVFPAVISAAGEVPGRGAAAIAQVATIGYAGFLVGAPLIGLLAHLMPLDRALLAVAGIVPLIAILAPAAKERSPQTVR
jgi:MFS family permease